MSKDYYNILGVEKTATQDEIKKKFREQAHKYHPDKEGGDEAKFKEINEAYQVLGNEEKRKQYDQFGSSFDQQGGFGGGMNWEDFMRHAQQGGGAGYQNINFEDLGEIFGDIFGGFGFGGSRAKKKSNRGEDLETTLRLDFNEALFGATKEIEVTKLSPCVTCSGTGAASAAQVKTCEKCDGKGQVTAVRQTMLGAMQTVTVCPECHGEGNTIDKPCPDCQGEGRRKETEKVSLEVPAGVAHGMTIRVQGKGNAGRRGDTAGDLYVHIQVQNTTTFERQGDDIYSKQEIPFSIVTLGGKIPVETVHGKVTLKIPAGTPVNKVFRIKGKGAPRFQRNGTGDHYVKITVEIPRDLSKKQKKLLQELQKEGL